MKTCEFTLDESCRRFVEENELGADPKFLEALFIHILTNDPDAIIWFTEYGLDNVAFFYMALGLPCSYQFLKRCDEQRILYALQDSLLVCYHSEQRNLIGECRVDAHINSRTNSAGSSGSAAVNGAPTASPRVPSTTNNRQNGSAQNRVVSNGAEARSGPSREKGARSLDGPSGPVVATHQRSSVSVNETPPIPVATNSPRPVRSQQKGTSSSNVVGPSTSAAVPDVPQSSRAPEVRSTTITRGLYRRSTSRRSRSKRLA
ncbi:hypothetical protein GCK72_022435 [Caenorhabditis remanei]|uniref:Uncharacterized protein n=1 Tax=Caenorhabditis remanei TaxID=31234 RepID=A0A6A5FU12_CAERE|nr:hypothetical protein GCK72_022435 [Caenorhabditis remanei]KAF1745985.1 hypothetical protein GCK72_022435 [Caenorhabditis remanei]